MGNEQVKSHFSRLAEQGVWASLYASSDEKTTSETWSFLVRVRHVMELLDTYGGTGDVLDLGCGTAPIARGVAALGKRYVGVDFSPEMVESAKEQNGDLVEAGEARMLVGDATNIDFPDGSCGAVTAMGVLEYLTIDQIRQALKEICRVLRPDGVTILTIPKRRYWGKVVLGALYPIRKMVRWRPTRENMKLEEEEEVRRLYHMPGELDQLCEEEGLAKVAQRHYNAQLFGRPLTLLAPRLCYLLNRPFEAVGQFPGGRFLCTGYIGVYKPS